MPSRELLHIVYRLVVEEPMDELVVWFMNACIRDLEGEDSLRQANELSNQADYSLKPNSKANLEGTLCVEQKDLTKGNTVSREKSTAKTEVRQLSSSQLKGLSNSPSLLVLTGGSHLISTPNLIAPHSFLHCCSSLIVFSALI